MQKNAGIKVFLEKELNISLYVPPEPQITGALGAALYGVSKKKLSKPILLNFDKIYNFLTTQLINLRNNRFCNDA
ncbi:hypothetical protein [Methanosarcina horonobensis]|uniref:hypothetical protein n=1 Tax=Methanosarcina horonobensis TaxID=418008 RepID=UPI0022B924DA|nr:hypothetical protein [Methanosarcina horonobensis]